MDIKKSLEKAKKKLSQVKLIITHPGSAHRDDFLAVGLALSLSDKDISVERRDPTERELDDSSVLILDIGLRHEPELNNYDHHHFERGTVACAFSVLAEDMGVDYIFENYDWYKETKVGDSQGPKKLAEFLGLPRLTPYNPIETAITELIKINELKNWPHLSKKIITFFIDRAIKLQERLLWYRKNCQTKLVRGIPVLIFPTDNVLGSSEYREEISSNFKSSIAIGIWHDNRGSGWRFKRYDDDTRIDFSKLKGNPLMHFCSC